MKVVETMTFEEAMTLFRSYGIGIAYEKLRALIDSGVGERQGWSVSGEAPGGKHFRIIFRKPLLLWLESLAEDKEVRQ